jgi:hypothetical protein
MADILEAESFTDEERMALLRASAGKLRHRRGE